MTYTVSAQGLPNRSLALENPSVVRDPWILGHVYRFSALDYSDFFEREGVYQEKRETPVSPE